MPCEINPIVALLQFMGVRYFPYVQTVEAMVNKEQLEILEEHAKKLGCEVEVEKEVTTIDGRKYYKVFVG